MLTPRQISDSYVDPSLIPVFERVSRYLLSKFDEGLEKALMSDNKNISIHFDNFSDVVDHSFYDIYMNKKAFKNYFLPLIADWKEYVKIEIDELENGVYCPGTCFFISIKTDFNYSVGHYNILNEKD